MKLETVVYKNRSLSIVDQTLLPNTYKMLQISNLEQAVEAIVSLRVRGAPAIGVFAAYALVIESINLANSDKLTTASFLESAHVLERSRPTAVNLKWAIDEIAHIFKTSATDQRISSIEKRAIEIHNDDREMCKQIGVNGAGLLKDCTSVLTHCNAGILATAGQGTALSVIYEAVKINPGLIVYADETRPLGQGARLTCFELKKNNVNCQLLVDGASASLINNGKVDAIIVGADRIAANGDVANKVGTLALAMMASLNNVPFYVAAPVSTFDMSIDSGSEIPIEQRSAGEVLDFWKISKNYVDVYNPAFDVTPARLITAIVTNNGVIEKPNKDKLKLFS